MTRALHLGRRFVRALWPGGPRERDVAWVAGILEPAELGLWRSLPNHDRRYTIRVAKLVEARLAGTEYAGEPRWLAAALLHDVGKLDAGTYGRCESCGNQIAEARLEAMPAARLCIDCASHRR